MLCIDSYRQCISIGPIYVYLLICAQGALAHISVNDVLHCHYQKCKTNGIQIGPRMERLGLSMYQDRSKVEAQLYCLLHMQEKKRERALYRVKALKFATAPLDHRMDKTPTGTTAILFLL